MAAKRKLPFTVEQPTYDLLLLLFQSFDKLLVENIVEYTDSHRKRRKLTDHSYESNHNQYPRTVPKTAPHPHKYRARTFNDNKMHFDIPDFEQYPTLKQFAEGVHNNKELVEWDKNTLIHKFNAHPDIVGMTLAAARDYKFPLETISKSGQKQMETILHGDDVYETRYDMESGPKNVNSRSGEDEQDLLCDDWSCNQSHVAFQLHLRNDTKSNDNIPHQIRSIPNGRGWQFARNELLKMGCDRYCVRSMSDWF